MFTALAEGLDDLDKKINYFVALAPVTYIGGSHSLFMETISVSLPMVRSMLDLLKIYEIYGPSWDEKIR